MAVAMPTYALERMSSGSEEGRRDQSAAILNGLRADGGARFDAMAELHALLLRGARHELSRRSELLAGVSRVEIDDLANHAADDALTAILAKLDSFRGESRFSTWAYKFVILEAGVKARRRAWRDREVNLDDDSWRVLGDAAPSVHASAESSELLRAISAAIETDLTDRQREIFTALALNEVPIDVLAERMGSTRGALYKTLHDARRKLRGALVGAGYDFDDQTGVAA
jgi:RNA polymerase sigma-70 factor (ECF subfamily)